MFTIKEVRTLQQQEQERENGNSKHGRPVEIVQDDGWRMQIYITAIYIYGIGRGLSDDDTNSIDPPGGLLRHRSTRI